MTTTSNSSSSYLPENLKITVGPVVGLVTYTSARILIETNQPVQRLVVEVVEAPKSLKRGPSLNLLQSTSGENINSTATSNALDRKILHLNCKMYNRPFAFTIDNLKQNTEYYVNFFSDPQTKRSLDKIARFKTFSPNTTNMRIVCLSCNQLECRDKERDMWERLSKMIESVDLVLHMGDQIYADEGDERAWQNCIAIYQKNVKAGSMPPKEMDELMLEEFRKQYRANYTHPPTAKVLASTSNMMMWDDHEICDDFGSRPSHCDPKAMEYYIGCLARRVYWEYERQLYDDVLKPVKAEPLPYHEGYFLRYGDIGIHMIDLRAGRGKDKEKPMLGRPQWDSINEWFSNPDKLGGCNALIVMSPVPFVFLGDKAANLLPALFQQLDDLMDHWNWNNHRPERMEYIRVLEKWKEANPKRNFLVIAGDSHLGAYTRVYRKDGSLFFEQMISSPITNHTYSSSNLEILRSFSGLEDTIGPNYKFSHVAFYNQRNFGIIDPDTNPSLPAVVLPHRLEFERDSATEYPSSKAEATTQQ